MAHLVQWDTSFNSSPVQSDKVGQTDRYIRLTRQAVSERIRQEHNLDETDLITDDHGKHLEGSARCFISAVDVSTPDVTIDTVYTGNLAMDFKNGRQYFNPKTRKLYVYVKNYTYQDAQGVAQTVDGFVEVLSTATSLLTGSCLTADSTIIKEADLVGFELIAGRKFTLVFLNASGASAQLDVNNTGVKAVYYNGASTTATSWVAGDYVEFFYDGTQYHVISVRKSDTLAKSVFVGMSLDSPTITNPTITNPAMTGTVTIPPGASGTDAVNYDQLDLKAPKESPVFTGVATINNAYLSGAPTADTPGVAVNNNRLATTAFVRALIVAPSGSQTFTSSGTFTVPVAVFNISVTGYGAGGTGGQSNQPGYSSYSGGGGGAGGVAIDIPIAVTPGQQITVTINNAGTSSFGSIQLMRGGDTTNGASGVGGGHVNGTRSGYSGGYTLAYGGGGGGGGAYGAGAQATGPLSGYGGSGVSGTTPGVSEDQAGIAGYYLGGGGSGSGKQNNVFTGRNGGAGNYGGGGGGEGVYTNAPGARGPGGGAYFKVTW